MKIEIMGPGCPRCQTLESNVKEALEQLGIDAEVEKITEIGKIAARGVLSTPGLAIDGKILSTGKLLTVEELKTMLKQG